MKKSYSPQYPITQKVLEEQIKKLRKVRPSPYSEEPVQADINVGESSGKKLSEEVIYANVIVGEPSGKPHPKPEETIYTEANVKKSYSPQYPITQKVLEEQIKKLRKVRPSAYSEEPVQADVNVGESSSKKLSEEVIYAEVIVGEPSGKPRQKPEETIYSEVIVGESSVRLRQEATVRAGTSSQAKLPLTQKELASKLQKNATVRDFQEKIRSLCETVYGKRNVLDKPFNKILRDPNVGIHLSYSLARNPEIFGPFRGRQVLCIKTPARKRAEADSWNLCETVEQCAYHVKQLAKEIRKPYPTKEQQHAVGEQSVRQRRYVHKQGMAM